MRDSPRDDRGTDKDVTGLWGERIAARHLIESGYKIIGRRIRSGRHGEIDIIVVRGNVLAFIEVKTRATEQYGRPGAAVDGAKKRTLCDAAAKWLRRAGYPDCIYRFDIIEVVGTEKGEGAPIVRHLEDAFRFPPRYRFPVRQGKSPVLRVSLFSRLCAIWRKD